MSTSHVDRKELKRTDEFVAKTSGVFQFVSEHARTFAAAAVALFGLALGFAIYSNLSSRKEERANSALFTARKALTAALEKAPKTNADWAKSAEKELTAVEKVISEFKGTRAAFEAQLLLGDTYFDRGSAPKALEYYKQAATISRPKSLKALAQHSTAYAYENSGKYDEAIEQLRAVLAVGDKSLRGDTLLALARNYELKGDKVRALEHYELVIKEFPGSPAAKSATARKGGLR